MLILHGDRKENKVALTFDDGPNPYGTPKVLGILEKFKVKATFFLIGKWVKLFPNIVKKIHKKGHLIGNHGYVHSRYRKDMKISGRGISKLLGKFPTFIRPPYLTGFTLYIPEILSQKFSVVAADILSYDWADIDSKEIIRNVVTKVKNGSIILFHDGSEDPNEKERCKEMIKALPKIIKVLKEKYNLVRLDQMKF